MNSPRFGVPSPVRAAAALALAACAPQPSPEPGDSAPDTGERYAYCGDGVLDTGEACDDANTRGGDGCAPDCTVETGTPESEPNDDASTAMPAADGGVDGALAPADVDCWSYDVPECGALEVVQRAPCSSALAVAVYDADGAEVAVANVGEDGCASVDPADQAGARWMDGGAYTVCVSAIADADVPAYHLDLSTVDPATLGAPAGVDADADAVPDSCDADDDNDGVDDAADDCPTVSNGPASAPYALSSDGFVTTWLTAGPFTGDSHTGECRPSDAARVGEDGALAPTLSAGAGTATWIAQLGAAAVDLTADYGTVAAPREAYAFVYLRADAAQDATLKIGADDGVFAWWNGARVIDASSCQGVNTDQFTAPVTISAGVNTLLIKVYDQGGGWGLIARLTDGSGAPITTLVPQLDPDPAWRPDQTDTDADGVGDICE